MEEFIAALFAGPPEILAEALFLAVEALIAFITRLFRSSFKDLSSSKPILATAGFLSLGICFGAASLFFFPHPLIRPSRFHGISLLISPIVTGLVMALIGAIIRRTGRKSVPIESFVYGFLFAFGIAAIRLAFAR
jgi:hypothetical protein